MQVQNQNHFLSKCVDVTVVKTMRRFYRKQSKSGALSLLEEIIIDAGSVICRPPSPLAHLLLPLFPTPLLHLTVQEPIQPLFYNVFFFL